MVEESATALQVMVGEPAMWWMEELHFALRRLSLTEFADEIGERIVIERLPGSDEYRAVFDGAVVTDGNTQIGVGSNPLEAMDEYFRNICGRTLAFYPGLNGGRTVVVPENIEVEEEDDTYEANGYSWTG